ncbi:MAG: hypothetical protein FWG73_02650 [Planctomycetaceae bacterium]|nr:hypothetical protein [Planctomycetaceae bacterium]
MRFRFWLGLILAFSVGMCCALAIRHYHFEAPPVAARDAEAKIMVLVATRTIPSGVEITGDYVAFQEVAVSEIPFGTHTSFAQSYRRQTAYPIPAGCPICEDLLLPPAAVAARATFVPTGSQFVSLDVVNIRQGNKVFPAKDTLSSLLADDQRVDIRIVPRDNAQGRLAEMKKEVMRTFSSNHQTNSGELILEGVPIHRVQQQASGDRNGPGNDSIMLMLDRSDASRLAAAARRGQIRVSIHGPEESHRPAETMPLPMEGQNILEVASRYQEPSFAIPSEEAPKADPIPAPMPAEIVPSNVMPSDAEPADDAVTPPPVVEIPVCPVADTQVAKEELAVQSLERHDLERHSLERHSLERHSLERHDLQPDEPQVAEMSNQATLAACPTHLADMKAGNETPCSDRANAPSDAVIALRSVPGIHSQPESSNGATAESPKERDSVALPTVALPNVDSEVHSASNSSNSNTEIVLGSPRITQSIQFIAPGVTLSQSLPQMPASPPSQSGSGPSASEPVLVASAIASSVLPRNEMPRSEMPRNEMPKYEEPRNEVPRNEPMMNTKLAALPFKPPFEQELLSEHWEPDFQEYSIVQDVPAVQSKPTNSGYSPFERRIYTVQPSGYSSAVVDTAAPAPPRLLRAPLPQ